jgi:hypothetical protein
MGYPLWPKADANAPSQAIRAPVCIRRSLSKVKNSNQREEDVMRVYLVQHGASKCEQEDP